MDSCVCVERLCRRKMTLSKKYREENDEVSGGQFKSMFAYLLKHLHTSLMKMFAKGYQIPEKSRNTFNSFSNHSYFFRGTMEQKPKAYLWFATFPQLIFIIIF